MPRAIPINSNCYLTHYFNANLQTDFIFYRPVYKKAKLNQLLECIYTAAILKKYMATAEVIHINPKLSLLGYLVLGAVCLCKEWMYFMTLKMLKF